MGLYSDETWRNAPGLTSNPYAQMQPSATKSFEPWLSSGVAPSAPLAPGAVPTAGGASGGGGGGIGSLFQLAGMGNTGLEALTGKGAVEHLTGNSLSGHLGSLFDGGASANGGFGSAAGGEFAGTPFPGAAMSGTESAVGAGFGSAAGEFAGLGAAAPASWGMAPGVAGSFGTTAAGMAPGASTAFTGMGPMLQAFGPIAAFSAIALGLQAKGAAKRAKRDSKAYGSFTDEGFDRPQYGVTAGYGDTGQAAYPALNEYFKSLGGIGPDPLNFSHQGGWSRGGQQFATPEEALGKGTPGGFKQAIGSALGNLYTQAQLTPITELGVEGNQARNQQRLESLQNEAKYWGVPSPFGFAGP